MKKLSLSLALLLIAASWQVVADDKKKDDKGAKSDAVKTEAASINTIKLDIPTTWEKETPRGLGRVAQYKVPLAEGDEKGEIVFYVSQFGGPAGGGSVDANIERWKKQFKDAEDPKTDKFDVGEFKIHTLDISGTYLGGPGSAGGETPDYRLMAAVVETKSDGKYFVRLAGSKKSVGAQADHFNKVLKSIKAN